MGDEDMMTSLARELVEQGHVGDSANKIWSDLRAQRELTMDNATPVVSVIESPAVDHATEEMFSVPVIEPVIPVSVVVVVKVVEDLPAAPTLDGLLQFVVTHAKKKRSAHVIVDASQMLLFA
jgi:hypothetical protein